MAGFVDGRVRIWTVEGSTGRTRTVELSHEVIVQGVAWDPFGRWIATQSHDNCYKIHSFVSSTEDGGDQPAIWSRRSTLRPKLECTTTREPTVTAVGVDEESKAEDKKRPERSLFGKKREERPLDAALYTRLSFSPDGKWLAVPSGRLPLSPGRRESQPCVHIFRKGEWLAPAGSAVCDHQAIVVRFCPVLFRRRNPSATSSSPGYRMVFAVGTVRSVLLFDTEHPQAIAVLDKLHLFSINDLCWSADGSILVTCSSDSYCSFVYFDSGELGTPLSTEETAAALGHKAFKKRPNNKKKGQTSTPPSPSATKANTTEAFIPKVVRKVVRPSSSVLLKGEKSA